MQEEILLESGADIFKRHLRAQPLSGLNVQQYCLRHEINKSTFYYWRKKISQPQVSAGRFVELKPCVTFHSGVTVYFSNNISICFDTLPPVDYLKSLTR